MHIEDILELRPEGKTAAAFRQAITKIHAKTASVEAVLTDLLRNRGVMLVSGSKKDLELSEKTIQQARESLDRLSDLASTLEAELPTLDRCEALAELRARFDAIGHEAKARLFADWWQTHYRERALAIVEGLELEAAAVEALRKAQSMRLEFEWLGEPFPHTVSPAYLAAGGLLACHTLGELVALPGEFGAPQIPTQTDSVKRKRIVKVPMRPDHDRSTPAHLLPMANEEIEEEIFETRALRVDQVMWPPKKP